MEAPACVVIVSKATERPTDALTKEWNAILRKTWSGARFLLFSVKRQESAAPPTFLKSAASTDLGKVDADLTEIVRKIADAVLKSAAENRA